MAPPQSADQLALGRALRELRTERGLSQEELAYRSGLSRNYVGNCERGEVNPSFSTLLSLTTGLGTTLPEVARAWVRERRLIGRRPR